MLRRIYVLALVMLLMGARAFAQAPGTATLRVTVVDPSNAVVVAAIVTVTGADPATSGRTIPPARSTDAGVATLSHLLPGLYTVQAEFPVSRPAC